MGARGESGDVVRLGSCDAIVEVVGSCSLGCCRHRVASCILRRSVMTGQDWRRKGTKGESPKAENGRGQAKEWKGDGRVESGANKRVRGE